MLRNLTLIVQFAYFCIKSNKGREQQFFFDFWGRAIFEERLYKKQLLTFLEQLLSNFLGNLKQPFGKFSRNLWKAPLKPAGSRTFLARNCPLERLEYDKPM